MAHDTTTDEPITTAAELARVRGDARQLNSGTPPDPTDHQPIRAAALTDRERLAALFYGGAPEAPDAGMTQAAIGDWLGVSSTTVSRWMTNTGIRPSPTVCKARATARRRGDADAPAAAPPDPDVVRERVARAGVTRGVWDGA